MQMRRRFQPMVDGLPYRIAPSTVAVMVPPSIDAAPGGGAAVIGAFDADPPQTGVGATLIVAPPTTAGDGTLVC
jgi:hypothetical protein